MKIKFIVFVYLTITSMSIAPISYADELKGNPQSKILIFVSFSMSNLSLKAWMRDAELIHAPLIIRGLSDNSFKSTVSKMTELTNDNHGGVQLDPTLFRRFQINQVPAVVVWKDTPCPINQSCIETYDVIYGDVTLKFALEKIAERHDELSKTAHDAIEILKGKSE